MASLNQELRIQRVNLNVQRRGNAKVLVGQPHWSESDWAEKDHLYTFANEKAPRLWLDSFLQKAQEHACGLILLPELSVPDSLQGILAAWTRQTGSMIIGGSHYATTENGIIARSPVVFAGETHYVEKIAEREPFYLHADEFQHFVTPSLEALLTAARKYRLGLTLAHQTLAQLKATPKVESALFGNAYTRIVFRTGDEEAKHLSEGFSFFEAKDIRELSRGEAVVRMGSASNDFGLKTFPVEPVSPELASTRKKAALSLTRKRYATPVEDLRAKLQELYAAKEEKEEAPVPVPPETAAESSVSERPVSPRKSEVVKAREEETQRKKVSPPDTPGRGGQEHKYLQHLVKRLAEERGFRALIEEAAGDGRADVVLSKGKQRIACEVSVTTDHLHEEENLRKCLAAGFERIVFIVPDRKRREKLKGHFQKIAATSSVAVISTEEIVGFLDSLETGPAVTESTVRGYKVKVTRQAVSPEELAGRRSAISDVIARSLLKHKEKE